MPIAFAKSARSREFFERPDDLDPECVPPVDEAKDLFNGGIKKVSAANGTARCLEPQRGTKLILLLLPCSAKV